MNKIGDRIRYLRDEVLKISRPKLAELCGWNKDSSTRIANYESNMREPDLATIKILASALGVTPWRLAFDENLVNVKTIAPKFEGIPIYGWHESEGVENLDFLSKKLELGLSCYALQIKDDLMTTKYGKSFEKGTYIIVDPDKNLNNDSFVIAKKDASEERLFRQYKKDSTGEYLQLLKDGHPQPILGLTSGIKICGVVVAHLDILT